MHFSNLIGGGGVVSNVQDMGVSTYKGRIFYYHPGMGDGMNSINLIFPKEKITITVIRNVFPPNVSSNEIAMLAADYIFED